jgi:hydrogenase 3 maturation protease
MKKQLVLTVGNEMMGDDAAGPILAEMISRSPLDKWQVLNGGSAPENYVFKIREMEPERVVVVDAADMDLQTGEIRLIDEDGISSLFLMTTHSLPLTYLMDAIQEFVPRVELIGIQPEIVAFGCPVSPRVREAVERVYAWLEQDGERPDAGRSNLGAIRNMDADQHGETREMDSSAQYQITCGRFPCLDEQ